LSRFNRLDKAIIECLNKDARASSAEIARELAIAERTVRYRIQRLTDQNVIRPITVVIPASFGYNLAVDIFCEVDLEYQNQTIDALLNLPEVTYVAISTGDQDIILQAIFKNSDEVHDFITHKLHQVPGMRRTRTVLVPRILKDTYQWLPPDDAYDLGNGKTIEVYD
jgi:Lrp/AsnC family transcriptional regulator for asnA, asnC and gidA